jgi:hypothetical protein
MDLTGTTLGTNREGYTAEFTFAYPLRFSFFAPK